MRPRGLRSPWRRHVPQSGYWFEPSQPTRAAELAGALRWEDQGMDAPQVREMTVAELRARKAELDKVVEVLAAYDMDSVCRELGEISYLLGDRR